MQRWREEVFKQAQQIKYLNSQHILRHPVPMHVAFEMTKGANFCHLVCSLKILLLG